MARHGDKLAGAVYGKYTGTKVLGKTLTYKGSDLTAAEEQGMSIEDYLAWKELTAGAEMVGDEQGQEPVAMAPQMADVTKA
ncbi:MAG: hypothetical protein FWE38_03170 [Firmicutes bacterium]|nr:hypothetical protein [Bacillota bacterium]